jgi:hypothetical protein
MCPQCNGSFLNPSARSAPIERLEIGLAGGVVLPACRMVKRLQSSWKDQEGVPMPKKRIDFDVVREIALALPDVEESTMRGAPSLKVRGRLLTCPALHQSAEPNSLAVRIDVDQRAELIDAEPGVYYLTDHYVNYPMVLVRLSAIDRKALRDLLEKAWRFASSKKKARG